MGVGANSSRNKALNDRKRRAAGRQNTASPERKAILDAGGIAPAKGKAGGAFGKKGEANRPAAGSHRGGGGGGASPNSDLIRVGRSSKRSRARGA